MFRPLFSVLRLTSWKWYRSSGAKSSIGSVSFDRGNLDLKNSSRFRRVSLVSEESSIFNEAESNNLCSFLEKNCGKIVNAWTGGYGWDVKFLHRTRLLGT